ncbi:MAG TPA: MFS transporter [Ignavibacteriales bacterium]|nr:MFS transporter [Ignavibacteriales bacterium]
METPVREKTSEEEKSPGIKHGVIKKKWNFPFSFWISNLVELFERSAYYAVFIAITLYLTRVVGYSDIWAAWIGGIFSAGLYLLPPFSGAFADKIGFRKAIILAFALLSVGYFTLGALPYKATVLPAIVILMLGGSFIKSIITGTVAKTTNEANRARAFSIFYGMVNVGSFLGKTFAYPLRLKWGLESINFYASAVTFLALIVVFIFYKNVDQNAEAKRLKEIWHSFTKILTNMRLLSLILIITGFWIIQSQLYATMPKYVLRTVGESASPEWIANVNPFVVMTTVVFITSLMSKVKAITSMTIGMFLMPVSALCMASSPLLAMLTGGEEVSFMGFFSAHPVTVMMIIGIVFQGLAECFISPRYLEFFSLQAPKGQEGLYMGFSHLHSFFAYLLGFGISGYLLTAYVPERSGLSPEALKTAYVHAHYVWYYFAAIGFTAAIALIIYNKITSRMDKNLAK